MLPRLAAKVSTTGDEYSSKKPGKSPILDRIRLMEFILMQFVLTPIEVEASVARCLRTPPDGA
jgi:hypothetical protein